MDRNTSKRRFKMKYNYELILPLNFSPEELLQERPPTGSNVITADGLALICDAIIKVRLRYSDEKDFSRFVPLHSQILHTEDVLNI